MMKKFPLLGVVVLLGPQAVHGFVPEPNVRATRSAAAGNYWASQEGGVKGDDGVEEIPTRRSFLKKTEGFMATAIVSAGLVAPNPANADPSIISSIQGPLQDAIAPGHWIGQFLGLNSRQVTWNFEGATSARVSQALVDVLNELTPQDRAKLFIPEFTIARADASKVHVITWTKNEWLDSLDVSLQQQSTNGCTAKASFYATGFLPSSIPGAPLVNIGFAWFPFASPGPRGQMLQDYRLQNLERLVRAKLVVDTAVGETS